MPLEDSTPLSALRKGQTGRILSIKAADAELLRHLDELGLTPGAKIEVRDYSPFDHNLTIKVDKQVHVLGLNITSRIFIEEQ
jgi:Fe2+ transport system protein FeoA